MPIIGKKNVSNIGKNLKAYRLEQGITQKEFADDLDINHQNYSKIERGIYTPSLEKILEICKILYITPNDLLLDNREYDDFKQEIFGKLDEDFLNLMREMKVVEEIRAKALKAKQKGDTRSEELYLTDIVGIYVIGGKGSWEAADALYYNRLDKLIKRASSNTLKALVKRLD
ncbi:helix-turn-helix transcriptional regulator [Listeria riparia]|uniref:Transcriptional repressor n=1 Tax=Listeria riparia FSL S10-1204 TaxID=1265816 RepID=W7D285_9LIST|nr:helix-turn-helix transcriptional regulator [Listeria riparia]EUJ43287.1 transcriptional repressor [Listeria riparia FSL S10-1204]